MSDTVEFLNRIRTRLLEKGWQQGDGGPGNGPNCLLGAAYWESENLTYNSWEYSEAEVVGLNILTKMLHCNCHSLHEKGYSTISITHWNDRHNRTSGEVIAALDNAIIAAKELEAQHAETILEALQLGRERLLDRGWCKNALADPQGRVCANGALWDARWVQDAENPWAQGAQVNDACTATNEASEFLSVIIRGKNLTFWFNNIEFRIPDIVGFNNYSLTTFNDVLALFDEGIQRAKELGI